MININTVIYADILIFINIFINYLLLRSEAAVTSSGFKPIRILISSAVGGLFSLIIFAEKIPIVINILLKIAVMSIMIIFAFQIKNFKSFMRHFAVFLTVNFIFSGIMLAINIFLIPDSSVYNNGIFYFDTDIFTLTVTSVICYLILNLINKFSKFKTPDKSIYPIQITYMNKTAEGKALFDSGNRLCDCFSGKPVIIAEKDFIEKITDLKKITEHKNFRLIPFSTIKGSGTLSAFSPDKVGIYINGKWIFTDKIFVGITEKKIISGDYSVLFGIPFYETVADQINAGGKHEQNQINY